MELITTIIPTHNARKWVSATLASVVAQTHPDIEIIVVDDGSEDDTVNIVREKLSKHFAGRWKLDELGGNRGPSAARNHGLKLARGSWIQFLDGDDLLATTKFQREMEYCRAASD